MPTETRSDRSHERHTGAHSLLKFDAGDGNGYYEIPVTDVSWTREYNTTDIQHNDDMNPTIATTGIRYNGSFEYQGQNITALEKLIETSSDSNIQENRPIRGTLTVKEYNHDDDSLVSTVTFKRVIVTNNERSLPSDDVSSSSFDFEAEDMTITNHTSE